jgi:2-phospho-L-lactate guanylyltransferase
VRTIAILPVKSFASAKQRLTDGLAPGQRQALAEAMFCDVLLALGQATSLDGVIVVTREARAREIAIARGVEVVADSERGHNAAAMIGIEAAIADGAGRALLVPGDCPALAGAEVDRLLSRPADPPSVMIVPDRHGTGTNALLLTPPDALAPSFGPGSCERHAREARTGGVHPEVVEVRSLATDVDTPEDLEALESSLGPADALSTRRLLRELTLSSKC